MSAYVRYRYAQKRFSVVRPVGRAPNNVGHLIRCSFRIEDQTLRFVATVRIVYWDKQIMGK